jgi:cell division protein FtsN
MSRSHVEREQRGNNALVPLMLVMFLLFLGVCSFLFFRLQEVAAVKEQRPAAAAALAPPEPLAAVKPLPPARSEVRPVSLPPQRDLVRERQFEEMQRRLTELQTANEKLAEQQRRLEVEAARRLARAAREQAKSADDDMDEEEAIEEKPARKSARRQPAKQLPVQAEEQDEFVEMDRIARGERAASPSRETTGSSTENPARYDAPRPPMLPPKANPVVPFIMKGEFRTRPIVLQMPEFQSDLRRIEDLVPQALTQMTQGGVKLPLIKEFDAINARLRARLLKLASDRTVTHVNDYAAAVEYLSLLQSSTRQMFVNPQQAFAPETVVASRPATMSSAPQTRQTQRTYETPTTTTRTTYTPSTNTYSVPGTEYYWVYE